MIPLPVIGIDDNDSMLRDNEGSIIVSCCFYKRFPFHLFCFVFFFHFILNIEATRTRVVVSTVNHICRISLTSDSDACLTNHGEVAMQGRYQEID